MLIEVISITALRDLQPLRETLLPNFLKRRCEAMVDLVIPQRQTLPSIVDRDSDDAVLVRVLYVINITEADIRMVYLEGCNSFGRIRV